jgi:plasmid stability protein
MHGAKAPQVRAAAFRRQVEAECRAQLERLGNPEPIGHPVEELVRLGPDLPGHPSPRHYLFDHTSDAG